MKKPTKRVKALMRLTKKQLVAKVLRSEQLTLHAQEHTFKAQQHAFNVMAKYGPKDEPQKVRT